MVFRNYTQESSKKGADQLKEKAEYNVFSIVSLMVLLVMLAFSLSGCGFFTQGPVANIATTPSASNGSLRVPVNEEISFDASDSRAGGGKITSFEWNFRSSSESESVSDEGENVVHSFDSAGTYTVELTVTTDSGRTDSTTLEVEVEVLEASFTMSPSSAVVEETVSFDASSSQGSITSYEWDFKSGRSDSATASGETATYSFSEAGTYLVQLTIFDDNGFTDYEQKSIEISSDTNEPPTADIATDTTSGSAPLEVQFDATGSSDPDGTIVSYEWDFGDGETKTGAKVSHTFNEDPDSTVEYTVKLEVTDDDGASATAQVDILAIKPPPPPG